MLHFDYVADGVNIGIGRAQVIVNDDAAARVHLKARTFSELAIGPYAYGEDNEFGRYRFAALERNVHGAARILKRRHTVAKIKIHAVFGDILMQHLRHLKIKRRHNLVEHFDD
ncbi:hypothetical protein SDC9_174326 [bioreactor metagenome]|uniref:Uncharacterized protein n=1 Tax=bioreactor metagenome TaxID=1076179 RepID=A0A645GL74_9ZZZZ